MIVSQVLDAKGHKVATVKPDAPLAEVLGVLKRERIGAVVVTSDDDKVAGIISERDIVRALPDRGASLLDMPVSELMTRDVYCCAPDHNVDQAMADMTFRRIRHIPVVNDERLVGILSIGDVVRNRLDELERENVMLRDYIFNAGRQ